MEQWDQEYIDEEREGYLEFRDKAFGEFHFGYVHGEMDCYFTTRDGEPAVEWTAGHCCTEPHHHLGGGGLIVGGGLWAARAQARPQPAGSSEPVQVEP